MLVWITRSQPGASRLAAALLEQGVDVLVAPVLEVEPVAVPDLSATFDVVVFLSESAVVSGAEKIRLTGSTVLAVGERTRTALGERGIKAEVPLQHSSVGLLELPALTTVSNKQILLISGESGLSILAEELTSRGATITQLAVYRRVAVETLAVEHCELLPEVGVIAVSSGDGFENAARLWFAANGNADVPVLVPSERVALQGNQVGLVNVHDCAGADSDAVLRGLENIGPH